MEIVLARIDDRLLHGQVVTVWTRATDCQRIIVCDDEVAKDTVRAMLLTTLAPPGTLAHVMGVEETVRACRDPNYGNDRCILLFENPASVLRLVELGVDIPSVNIGSMSFRKGRRRLTAAVSVDEEDISAFRALAKRGVELEVRRVDTDEKRMLMEMLQ